MISPVTGESGQALLRNLTALCNIIAAGQLAPTVCQFFFGARLIGLAKKDGGIRPIAVGNTLRRVVSKAACATIRDKATAFLAPKQLGFGLSKGAEGAAHAARRFLSAHMAANGETILLKIDFTNAFNSLRRDRLLEQVKMTFPELYNLVHAAYGDSSILQSASEGVQQGDPLGVLLFCLAIHPLVEPMSSELNIWYCDDGTLGGSPDCVYEDYVRIKELGSEMGLSLNIKKTELSQLSCDNKSFLAQKATLLEQFGEVALVRPESQTLLGAAIGGKEATELALTAKLEALERMCSRLELLDAHDGLFLLSWSFSLPRLMYLLRTTPCYQSSLLDKYDETVRICLEAILNIKLTGDSLEQATLPVKHGGLGLRSASDVALPAFISSVKGSSDVTSRLLDSCSQVGTEDTAEIDAVARWKTLSGKAPPTSTAQNSWDEPLVLKRRDALLETAPDDASKARLLGVSAPGSGAWLQALPSNSMGLRLSTEQIRIAVGLRLGCDLCLEHRCTRCDQVVDSKGHHGLHCLKGSAGRFSRHAEVNGIIGCSLQSANIPNLLEPQHISRNDGKRPDGLTLIPWKKGRPLIWDFTCADTMAPSYLHTAMRGKGQVANEAERKKVLKYGQLTAQYFFVPIAMETLGAWGGDADAFLKDLGHRIEKATLDNRSTAFLRQRISGAVQRGNASSVLGTLPQGKRLEDVYYCLFSGNLPRDSVG